MLKVNAICAYYIRKKNIIKYNNKNSQDNEKAKKRTDFSGEAGSHHHVGSPSCRFILTEVRLSPKGKHRFPSVHQS